MQQPSLKRIPQPRLVGLGFLFIFWIMFAAWQWTEYVHQTELIRDSLTSQADALSSAVGRVVQSHRWFSPFVQEQLPATLGVLAKSKYVIAIALVVNEDADNVYYAGDQQQVDFNLPVGEHSIAGTLQVVRCFTMQNDPPNMYGRSRDKVNVPESDAFRSIVVLDRSATIAQIQREARNRVLIFALGTLLLLAAGAVWQFTVRLAHAEGTTRVLKAETRHLRELGRAAAGLAHETRNPLGLIRGWTQRLVEAGLPCDEQQEQAEAVLEECDRVTARINQFLAFRTSDGGET